MTSFTVAKILSIGVLATVAGGVATFSASPAAAQVTLSQCDQIQDRARRQRCRAGVYDSQRYREEERTWKEAEDDIRRRHERACRQVGLIAKFTRSGGILRAACVAPRIINDARNR